jgi:hypothetical protein
VLKPQHLGWFGGHLLTAAGVGAAGGLGGGGGGGGRTAAVAGRGGATAGFGGGGGDGGAVRMASCLGGGEFARFRSAFGGVLIGLTSGLARVALVGCEPPLLSRSCSPELVLACVPVTGFVDVAEVPFSSLRLVVLPLSSLTLLGLGFGPVPEGDVVVPSLLLPGVKPPGPVVGDEPPF